MSGSSSAGSVAGETAGLDDRTGVLVVYEPAASRGRSVFAWPRGDKGKRRDRSAPVIERSVDGRRVFAAVFPRLPVGAYDVASPWCGHACRVTVEPRRVTEVDWR